jgi:enediyne biosynthesis protein E4
MTCVAVLAGCTAPSPSRLAREPAPGSPSAPLFADVTLAAGITNRHHKPILDHQLDNIMSWLSSVGAAAAAGDYNRDGWMDLYVTDSRRGWPNHLYRNNKDGTFTDVAPQAGLADLNGEQGASMDCVWGDFDNDGWPDLYLVRWGNDALFRNNGDGTFTDVTRERFRKRDGSPGIDWANGNAAIFLDYNLDGRLDLYVGNYFEPFDLWHLSTTRIMHDDFEKARNAGRNSLYRQNPDGTFTEVAGSLGLDDPGWTLAVGSGDLNNDGWPDLYCADDFGPDQLFINNKDGTFSNQTETAVGFDTKKGMNVEIADLDGDGWLDVYVANITTAEYLQEGNMLWHNNGPGPDGRITFTDISLETGTYDGGWGWGAKAFDYDHDGDQDILAVNGFISAGAGNYWYDLASWTVKGQDVADARNWPTIGDRSFSGYERTRLWRNDGGYAFSERAHELGLDSDRDGRGLVCFDYDNDGDLDVFVANQDQPPNLYQNRLHGTNHWLMVGLEGDPKTGVNRDAVGTRVTLVTARGQQIRERNGGNGYAGQSDPRLHFGLGVDNTVQLLEVRWPDGGVQYWENVPADQHLSIRQDPARYTTQLEISQSQPKPWQRPKSETDRAVPKLDPAALDRILSEMETRLEGTWANYKLASAYRARCADYNQHDRAIKFFSARVAAQPADWRARLELACAYVDKIPTCGGMAAIVSKGTLARKSLDQLDAVLKEQPDLWVAHYTRGMNHLHWPRALRHSKDAVADLERCVALQERDGRSQSGPKPYGLRAYVALGDAWSKAGQPAKARRAWRQGLKLFPEASELKARLEIENDSALLKFVEKQRSLEHPIDTDLSFLDREP